MLDQAVCVSDASRSSPGLPALARTFALCAALTFSPAFAPNASAAQPKGQSLSIDAAMSLSRSSSESSGEKIGAVREAILKEVGQTLGARIGLSERSREILKLLDERASDLDKRFDFGRLVIGNNVLPPVISESRDVVSMGQTTMRVAGTIFRIDEPARFAVPSPTWRNWLWIGLDPSEVSAPDLQGSLPATAQEREFWKQAVREGYEIGRRQAQDAFDLSMSTLERTYSGMRRYYDLWSRGVVTAPVIASASSIVRSEDPNTIAVGDTLFRITAPSTFTSPQTWQPLDAPLER